MRISEKLNRSKVSGTVHLAQLARELAEAGRDIIDLAEGEPDFDTPGHIIGAAFAAARRGETRYTAVAGTAALRTAIAAKFREDNKLHYAAEDIIVGTGAKQLIFNAFIATLDPGDEVIVPAPYWTSYPEMVRIADGTPVLVPCQADQDFKLGAADLEAHLTPQTRWIVLNSPGNPTGAVYEADDLLALAEVMRRHPHVGMMCDDIYEAIVFDGAQFATMAQVAPDLRDRVLTVNGVSKCYAMTGWRIGYAGGPSGLIAAMTKLQGQSTTNASSVSQAAALAALTGPRDTLAHWRAAYARRRDLVADALSGSTGLGLNTPRGAFYFFMGCDGYFGRSAPDGGDIASDIDLSGYLLEAAGVALVPGSAFGAPGHLRLCFAKSDAELEDACGRICGALGRLA